MVVKKLAFVLPSYRDRLVIFGPALDRFSGEINVNLRFFPADALDPLGRDQYFFPRPPISRIDHKVANGPSLLVNQKVLDMTDFAIERLNVITADFVGTMQMSIDGLLSDF